MGDVMPAEDAPLYEAVYPYPQGRSTAHRFAQQAVTLGYDGLVVLGGVQVDSSRCDVVDGAVLSGPDVASMSGGLHQVRAEHTMVLVEGGDHARNRFAVDHPAVDVLVGSIDDRMAVNHVIVRTARAHDVAIAVDLGPLMTADGGSLVRYLQRCRELIRLLQHEDAPYVITTAAHSHRQLRAPRDLTALASLVDIDPAWVTVGLQRWGRIIARNRRRQDAPAPGVTVEEDP
jgi:ribonuclease P/MRP protein subunit RPP1